MPLGWQQSWQTVAANNLTYSIQESFLSGVNQEGEGGREGEKGKAPPLCFLTMWPERGFNTHSAPSQTRSIRVWTHSRTSRKHRRGRKSFQEKQPCAAEWATVYHVPQEHHPHTRVGWWRTGRDAEGRPKLKVVVVFNCRISSLPCAVCVSGTVCWDVAFLTVRRSGFSVAVFRFFLPLHFSCIIIIMAYLLKQKLICLDGSDPCVSLYGLRSQGCLAPPLLGITVQMTSNLINGHLNLFELFWHQMFALGCNPNVIYLVVIQQHVLFCFFSYYVWHLFTVLL